MPQKVDLRTFYLLKVPSDLLKTQKVALIWNLKYVNLSTTVCSNYSAVYDLGATMLTRRDLHYARRSALESLSLRFAS